MADGIQTSTPLVFNKFIPPPPRRLWSADSPMEQLYRNKWMQYRNSMSEKDPWNALDSPHFVDFKELPDVQDNYFDEVDEDKISTPTSFQVQQRLPDFDLENNNVLDDLKKCTLSAIKPMEDDYNRGQATNDFNRLEETIKRISRVSDEFGKIISSTIKVNDMLSNVEKGADCGKRDSKKNVVEELASEPKSKKKTCTMLEPFSFETREKFRQEHVQERRERDSSGRELRKGFRATPLPKFLKIREKVSTRVNTCSNPKGANKNNDVNKMTSATDVCKKKVFQPVPVKRAPIVPRAPNLMTAARAKERQRFEEEMKKKELERQELRKKEEAERKKREEEEIAKLRRGLVHKAQPIRKYKIVVPRMTKRVLADPTIPFQCKRPRKC
ncbi:uncharacterized protein mei-38 [Venturia canescens]|uniref:uncharacterized protein mei-38 n=1 Tax=Venturia canescens TaxID=32260 RepID=UPI001C9D03F3|nr:uncharacterized protein LOC122413264 [Venturia canescens]